VSRRRASDPFALVLNHAADRLYLKPVWLGDDLKRDSAGTLFTLSARPESFGILKPCHDAEMRRVRLQDLLTAARAYVNASRKHDVDAVKQPELALPKRQS
jgi:hypothetical protein